jgi:tetratricopeptide (TPR) repeat protein
VNAGSHADRAELLLEAGQAAAAEREARAILAADPHEPYAQVLLARALIMLGRADEAVETAREAVAVDPDEEFALFTLGLALIASSDLTEAEQAIRAAIGIDPEEAAFHQALAAVLLQLDRREEALAAAEQARTLAPHDAEAAATHAHALVALGRANEGGRAARDALAIDPTGDIAHLALGLAGLHCGDSDQALAGFREALRLDPTDEAAREGLVLALKARHPVYSALLRFFLWQGRLPKEAQWALLFAPLVVGRLIRTTDHTVWFFPLAVVFIGFVVLTWAADPFMTLTLLATREGRYVVGRDSRIAAALFGGFVVAAVAAGVGSAFVDSHLLIVTFGFVVFALAAGNVDSLPPHRRKVVYRAAAALTLTAVLLIGLVAAGAGYSAFVTPAVVLILGAAASLWYVRLAS